MAYIVLARKYRPQTFDEVIAQDHITGTLKNAIKTDHIAQAFLFSGPRGVGKTSMARILAKALNCEKGPTDTPCNECKNCVEITRSNSVDVIEIDGASNTSVEDIRGLQNELLYPPQSSQYKIYIIDEVHMLSKNAFNALLKTLEEPPKNVKFIFATTEPHKVLATITSRCQRYDFHRIPISMIVEQIKAITPKEHITFDDAAIFMVAKKADGSLRDALSLMDQIVSIGKDKITKEDVLQVFGIVNIDVYHSLVQKIIGDDEKGLIEDFHHVVGEGNDINELTLGLIEYFRNILMIKIGVIPEEVHSDEIDALTPMGEYFTEEDLLYAITLLVDTKDKLRTTSHPVLLLETSLLKLANIKRLVQVEDLSEQKHMPSFAPPPPKEKKTSEKILFEKKTESRDSHADKTEKKEQEKKDSEIELTEDMIKAEWPSLLKKLQDEMPIISNHFSKATIKNISNNFIHYSTNSRITYQMLNEDIDKIAKIFSAHFKTPVKVVFEFEEPKTGKKYMHGASYEEIKKKSPKLADMIKAIDGYIIEQKPD